MPPTHLRLTGALCAMALALPSCADNAGAGGELDAAAAAVLADGAERLADRFEDGDGCAVLDEADALLARSRDGVAAGTVPAPVADEVEAVVADLTPRVDCDVADEPEPTGRERDEPEPEEPGPTEPEPDEPGSDDEDDETKGNGKGRGNGKGKNR